MSVYNLFDRKTFLLDGTAHYDPERHTLKWGEEGSMWCEHSVWMVRERQGESHWLLLPVTSDLVVCELVEAVADSEGWWDYLWRQL